MGEKERSNLEEPGLQEILLLDDCLIQKFLREALAKDLVVVLKHVPAEIINIIEKNISERARLILREDLGELDHISQEEFLEAQQRLSNIIKKIQQDNKTS